MAIICAESGSSSTISACPILFSCRVNGWCQTPSSVTPWLPWLPARHRTADVEQFVDYVAQLARWPGDDRACFQVIGRAGNGSVEHIARGHDGAQRRAQLMAEQFQKFIMPKLLGVPAEGADLLQA